MKQIIFGCLFILQTPFIAYSDGIEKKLEMSSEREQSVYGKASNAKAGAVILTADRVIYIENLKYWADEFIGEKMIVTGFLEKKKYIPDPNIDDDGIVAQGAEGEQYIGGSEVEKG